jgi:hypothetical protein
VYQLFEYTPRPLAASYISFSLASNSIDRLCLVLLECFNDIICISRDKNKSERGVDEDEINGRRVTRQVNGEGGFYLLMGRKGNVNESDFLLFI